jgi:geranylgeranyl reductase family protein
VIAASSPAGTAEVIVVGAGPAGSTAARTLAEAGVRVQLLDRAAFPRNKPCGGGISMRLLIRFPHLRSALPRIATHHLSRLYLEGPGGQAAVVESDEPAALMIRRVEFDALLVSLAAEAGAALVSGADIVQARDERDRIVLTSRDGREFAAPIVVAADGVHSVVARRLGLHGGWPPSAVALDMMEETPREALRDVDPSTLWVAYGCNLRDGTPVKGTSAPEGYAYIFPKRDHVNIGIGYVLSYFREAIDHAPYDLQRAFVERLRDRGLVIGESVRRNFTPFLIPVGGPLAKPGRGGVLLAGDAGGFVNGFTAEGIYYAMVSGDLAARAIVSSRATATLARRYARACDHEIGTELRDSVLIRRYLFGDSRRIARVIRGARSERRITRLILDVAIGRRSYADVRRRLLVTSPLLAGCLLWQRVVDGNRLFGHGDGTTGPTRM